MFCMVTLKVGGWRYELKMGGEEGMVYYIYSIYCVGGGGRVWCTTVWVMGRVWCGTVGGWKCINCVGVVKVV